MADNREGKAPGAPQQPAPAETKLYTVAGPGSVMFGGEMHPPGKELQLTEENAASLGAAVRLGKMPPPDVIEKRRGGKYRVAAERNLWLTVGDQTGMRGPGFELELSQEEARKLGDSIEPVAAA